MQIFDEKLLHDVLVRHTKMLNQKIMNKSQKSDKGFHEEVPKSDAEEVSLSPYLRFLELQKDRNESMYNFTARMETIYDQWEQMKYISQQEEQYEENLMSKFGDLNLEHSQLEDVFHFTDKYVATIEKFQAKLNRSKEAEM